VRRPVLGRVDEPDEDEARAGGDGHPAVALLSRVHEDVADATEAVRGAGGFEEGAAALEGFCRVVERDVEGQRGAVPVQLALGLPAAGVVVPEREVSELVVVVAAAAAVQE